MGIRTSVTLGLGVVVVVPVCVVMIAVVIAVVVGGTVVDVTLMHVPPVQKNHNKVVIPFG